MYEEIIYFAKWENNLWKNRKKWICLVLIWQEQFTGRSLIGTIPQYIFQCLYKTFWPENLFTHRVSYRGTIFISSSLTLHAEYLFWCYEGTIKLNPTRELRATILNEWKKYFQNWRKHQLRHKTVHGEYFEGDYMLLK